MTFFPLTNNSNNKELLEEDLKKKKNLEKDLKY